MRTLDVDARSDDSRPEGGHAVLLFAGLELPAEPVRFILRPLDPHIDPDRLDELLEPQDAIAARAVEGGCELVLGPQTTAHPALETGAIVAIELADLACRAEFVWPAIPPLARPRRQGLQIKKMGAARAITPAPRGPSAPMMMQPVAGASAAPVTMSQAAAAPMPGSATPMVASAVRARPLVQPVQPTERRSGAVTAAADMRDAEAAAAPGVERGDNSADYVVFYPHARGGDLRRSSGGNGARPRASLLPSTPGGAALTTAVVLLGLAGLLSLSRAPQLPVVAGSAVTQTAVPAVAPVAPRNGSEAAGEASLFDLLSPGAVSPRGASAKDVTPQKALELAQSAVQTAGAPRDPEEAAFWLRRYVASIGNDERTRRALTQLGSAYADSSNKSFDFARARQVWELASAFGDPVAMCFLGVLHENGLSGPVDRKLSLAWYERAKGAGGCPGLDEAMARVKS
ncbi:MAG: hypothetical protein ACKVP7_16715 [Hyphomicrobiaceae bacterium]